ncbi:MAG: M20/M25/M40 family metallo-hydrolase [Candidatus Woesearchaeota archaeon]
MKKYDSLLKLINAFGVSGKEMEVRDIITKEIRQHVSSVNTDKMGNLIAHKKTKSRNPYKIMIAAHMDEIGLIIKNIEKDGKVRIATVGGMDPVVLLNEEVVIKTRKGDIPGVITTDNISCSLDAGDKVGIRDMFVDTGLSKSELEKEKAHIGSFISLYPNAEIIGNGKVVLGKALDDRIGCYILMEVIKRLKNPQNEVFFVFTVQEEVGLYGAKTSSYIIEPDMAIAVDVTDCDDWLEHPSKTLGAGPTLTIKDEEMISSPCIDDQILKIAKKKKIPIQPDVSEGGTTDAINISISKGGVPSAVVGVPVRGLHSPSGLAHLDDIDNAVSLLVEFLKNPPDISAG